MNDYPFQFSCLENSMDRGAWRATVHGVTRSQTRLGDLGHTQVHFKKTRLQGDREEVFHFIFFTILLDLLTLVYP